MTVFALWSAPRARSTAFFRSMAERGDLTVLHEPFCNIQDHGETDASGQRAGGDLRARHEVAVRVVTEGRAEAVELFEPTGADEPLAASAT